MENNNMWVNSDRINVCGICKTVNRPFSNMQVKNAWQKEGFNHYQYECTRCGTDNEFQIRVQKEDE